jgi:F0F1-type ATP synthase assembly protein I
MEELINGFATTARWFIWFIMCCLVGACVGAMIALAIAFPLPCIVFLLLWIAMKN